MVWARERVDGGPETAFNFIVKEFASSSSSFFIDLGPSP
jgi:hypothetical protein